MEQDLSLIHIFWDDSHDVYTFEKGMTCAGASGGPSWYIGADAIWLDEYTEPINGVSICLLYTSRQSSQDTGKAQTSDRSVYALEYGYDLNNNVTKLINITRHMNCLLYTSRCV